ncbi:glycosyltransferase [Escherichia coli]|uniref:Putative glycosyltransferase n=2 Tax=Escherichia coli TaxID=562 RepID=A0A0A8J3S5_ECOLX|nr:glycosyltransferase [Escherichia coli]AUY77091.1 sugar transferase [Escherichia coli]EET2948937.1 glycosyltransferase [Escherichia coli]EET6376629.1 glycosyltransferase [Escherichia coli]EET7792208.1 glycosyltransferase [Escherichia coli]EEW6020290.1 glycosyltransferase [Escherichia coli]
MESKVSVYAPVILFVYARYEHTKKTIEALADNYYATETELIIYSDYWHDENDKENVNKVRRYIKSIKGFKSITIIERETNYGLAKNIIEGVTDVCNKYERVIILEDDLLTSRFFLKYMNHALEKYELNEEVWHISGWNYPIDFNSNKASFLWRVMNCWGWATWSNRWRYFEKKPSQIISEWDAEKIKAFNLDGYHDFFEQIIMNYEGRKNTWAIFWYATIFINNGLCLNPINTYVKNIGYDGSGQNCGVKDIYKSKVSQFYIDSFPDILEENELAVKEIKKFFKKQEPSVFRKIAREIRNYLMTLCKIK